MNYSEESLPETVRLFNPPADGRTNCVCFLGRSSSQSQDRVGLGLQLPQRHGGGAHRVMSACVRSQVGGRPPVFISPTKPSLKKNKLISVNLPLEKPSKDSHGLLSTRCMRATQALSKCQRANGIEKESGGPLCNLSLGLGH